MSLMTELRTAAALATGCPTLVVPTLDPDAVLGRLEDLLGPLPQAEAAGDCELWVDLPGLRPEDWLAVAPHLPEGAHLLTPESAGRRAALDLGLLVEELVEVDGLELVHRIDVEVGLSVWPQLLPGLPDPAVLALEVELVAALGRGFSSDRGPGTVQPVTCPATGRLGVVLAWSAPPDLHGLAGALGTVVRERAKHHELRLDPTVEVDQRMGLSVLLWVIAPAVPVLAADLPFATPMSPTLAALGLLLTRVGEGVRGLEVQVVPATDHLSAALAAASVLERTLPTASPGVPRWLGEAFCPTWTVELEPELVLDGLMEVCASDAVSAVRVLPRDPDGLTLPSEVFDLGGMATEHGWVIRMRNGVTGRDLLPAADRRETSAQDDAIEARLYGALAEAPGASWVPGERLARTVRDPMGRDGIELVLDPADALEPDALAEALGALLALELDDFEPLVWLGRRGGEIVVQWWRVQHHPNEAAEA